MPDTLTHDAFIALAARYGLTVTEQFGGGVRARSPRQRPDDHNDVSWWDGRVSTGHGVRLDPAAVEHYVAMHAADPHARPDDRLDRVALQLRKGMPPHPPLPAPGDVTTPITFLYRVGHSFGAGGHTVHAYTGEAADDNLLGSVAHGMLFNGHPGRKRRILYAYDHRAMLVTAAVYDPATTYRTGFGEKVDWMRWSRKNPLAPVGANEV